MLLAKNQQAMRQLKFIINNGVEADLNTAQGFEALSAGLSGAVNGAWQVVTPISQRGPQFHYRRGEVEGSAALARRDFWIDGPLAEGNVSEGAEK